MLQLKAVYSNVTKGVLAKSADIEKVFGTTDVIEVCKIVCVPRRC